MRNPEFYMESPVTGKTLFISAGDYSGDMLAGRLAARFSEGGWKTEGIGGAHMASSGVHLLENIISRSTIGFVEPFRNIPYFIGLLGRLKKHFRASKPDALIVVDFWGFHSHLIKAAAVENIPVYYYVSPQVWASRPGRVKKIKKFVKKVFTVFPFEEEFYKKRGVDAVFAGHPLSERLPEPSYGPSSPYLGILPGSRKSELAGHLKIMTRTAGRLAKKYSLKVLCFKAPSLKPALYRNLPAGCELIEDTGYVKRKKLRIALSASGTATVENAMLGIPTAIIYRTSFISYRIAKMLIKTDFIGMPNILLGREVMPEFIQGRTRPELILPAMENMLKNGNLGKISKILMSIRKELASKRAEETVFSHIDADIQ